MLCTRVGKFAGVELHNLWRYEQLVIILAYVLVFPKNTTQIVKTPALQVPAWNSFTTVTLNIRQNPFFQLDFNIQPYKACNGDHDATRSRNREESADGKEAVT